MKIKFLKTLGSYRKGTVRNIPDVQARFFIAHRIAVEDKEPELKKVVKNPPVPHKEVEEAPKTMETKAEEFKEETAADENQKVEEEKEENVEESTARRRGRPPAKTYETKVVIADIDDK